ncbi:hypothetical protein [Leptolyngbya sp. 7M]|uniref:hypothetical protein n=1 Tax=Leptolyngbya sp. 7M TaxID=2812896 RepID=UPI001B8D5D58|nr:hypothetical protein [Leptolyngbya sp. 7M]QYO62584.1 hypothetical protein JVX88_21300 [Leptolyngbya sp. 7M]
MNLVCPGRFTGFTASPDLLDALNQPATITFLGKGLDNAYGEPALAFYDEFGNVVASTQAIQSLWDDGEIEGIVVNLPDISQVFDGVYSETQGAIISIRQTGLCFASKIASISDYRRDRGDLSFC